MNDYSIRPFCRKKIEDTYFLLLKKRIGEVSRVVQINEVGNTIVSLLESGVRTPLLFGELSKQYAISTDEADEVQKDIEQFISGLISFGLLFFKEDNTPTFESGTDSNPSSREFQIGMLERIYKKKGLLYKVFLEITYACNLRCKHCYRTEAVVDTTACNRQIHMDYKMILDLLDELEEEGVVEVYITGGEAFLHPDIFSILRYATKKNFLTTVLTNGNVLANKDIVNRLINFDLFDIRISIYGDRKAHDNFTAHKGSFDKSMSALERVNRVLGIGTAVYVATQESIGDIDCMIKEFRRKGINFSINPVITPTSEGALFPLKYRLSLKDYEKLCTEYPTLLNGSTCTAGISRLRITPQGDVDGCEMLPDSKLGNLHMSNLAEILNSDRRINFVEGFKNVQKEFPCSDCKKRPFCNVCPGAFYLETKCWGTVPKYRCGMTNAKMHSFGR